MDKATVICTVSIRNDSWVLKDFIECAQTWADLIIIGDHNSTDDSVHIAQQFDCVKLIQHQPSSDFGSRRGELLAEARKVPGRRLIFAVDVDEMLSANWVNSPEWKLMMNAEPGTWFAFDWIELLPGLEQGVVFWREAAFVDDGSEYDPGESVHAKRIPETAGEAVMLEDIKLLHYIAIDQRRIFSKHRYYKCYEFIEFGKRPWAVSVYYQDTNIETYDLPVIPLRKEWLKGYDWLDEYRSINEDEEKCFWTDEEILDYFDNFGIDKFRKLNIWDGVDWNEKARLLGREGNYEDPRSLQEIWVHRFIERNRADLKLNKNIHYKLVRLFAKTSLRVMGW